MIEIEKRTPTEYYHEWVIKGTNCLHREDGPARQWSGGRSGTEEWWVNHKLHRIDGPAITYITTLGNVVYQWFIYGNKIDKNEVEKWLENNNYTWPFDESTKTEFLLRFG